MNTCETCFWLCGEGEDCEVLGHVAEHLYCANIGEDSFPFARVFAGKLLVSGSEFVCRRGGPGRRCGACRHWRFSLTEERPADCDPDYGICRHPELKVGDGFLVVHLHFGCICHETLEAHDGRMDLVE